MVAVIAALVLAPLVSSRALRGAGPAYWEEPARAPMHYPAAAAAVEGFVVNPMGGPSFCNVRLVKPVCADGVWVQNRCIAQLQSLKVMADKQCLETKEVFSGAPAASTANTAAAVTQPIPVTEADMRKHAAKGYIFRGVAAPDMPGNWRVSDSSNMLESRRSKGLMDASTRFWWSAPGTGAQTPK
jgi:hypothetical protein